MRDSDSLRFACPGCGQHIECTAVWAGVELDCPACMKRIRAPFPVMAAIANSAPVLPLAPASSSSPPTGRSSYASIHSDGNPRPVRGITSSRRDNAEELRQNHLSHEAHVKAVGFLYIVAGCLFGISGCTVAFDPETSRRHQFAPLYGLLGLTFALTLISTGMGLRKLRPWSRTLSGVIAGVGLLIFPVGTLVNGLVLYLLFSDKGSMVFSDLYRRVIAATPHLKYRTPILIWILLGLVLLLFIAGAFYAAFSGSHGR